ncbi:MAG TPA: hypothetical protein VLY21_02510 [Nitrososphaerales archaeon]|nr:hypothetical protein [Nitrososphaerales archaeon]
MVEVVDADVLLDEGPAEVEDVVVLADDKVDELDDGTAELLVLAVETAVLVEVVD